jgi:periplasmic protein TonB
MKCPCSHSMLFRVVLSSMFFCIYFSNGVIYADDLAPKRVRVAGNIQRKNLIHEVPPRYPPLATKNHIEGTVKLEIIIGVDGKVRQLKILSGQALLAQAAIEAVRQWEYYPLKADSEPVEVVTTVDVNFKLP